MATIANAGRRRRYDGHEPATNRCGSRKLMPRRGVAFLSGALQIRFSLNPRKGEEAVAMVRLAERSADAAEQSALAAGTPLKA